MGFYHPATIVRDAALHGQMIHPIDVNRSDWLCTIEADGPMRLGLRYVKGLREATGRRLEAELAASKGIRDRICGKTPQRIRRSGPGSAHAQIGERRSRRPCREERR